MRLWYKQKNRHALKALYIIIFLLSLAYAAHLTAQDSESFFDDEVPDDKKNSGDLKSKPIELRANDEDEKKRMQEEERKRALRQTDEKGEALAPKAVEMRRRDDGPTEQVAPLASRPHESILDNSRFSVAGDYFLNTGRGTATLPTGWGAFLAYDVDESNNHGFDLRFEGGFLNIAKGDSAIQGGYFEAGFSWLFRVPKMPIQFMTALQPGLGYYNFKDSTSQGSALKFTGHVVLGIEFPMLLKQLDRTDELIPFLQVRGGLIYDNILPVVAYGVYAGLAYKFGAVVFKY